VETTALGAAMLAGLGAGLFGSLDDAVKAMRGEGRRFVPEASEEARQSRAAQWRRALQTV